MNVTLFIIASLVVLFFTAYNADNTSKNREREKWCAHYHETKKSFDECLVKPDYEKDNPDSGNEGE